jgi:hypothetical protein
MQRKHELWLTYAYVSVKKDKQTQALREEEARQKLE